MLPLEGDGGTLGVVLVITAGRAIGGARNDRGELALELCELCEGLVTIGIQQKLRYIRLSHLRHLSF
jgi:hypothetical protein